MGAAYRMIFFLKSFSAGILMPVLSLLFLARGASLNSLAWMIGAYSLTAVVMEFPSGVFCDLFGRKKTFLVSCGMMLTSFVIILMFSNVGGVLTGFIIQGMARAFSSGSLDALVIEQGKEAGGECAIAGINGELNILESLGIAAGSLVGGALAGVGTLYRGNVFGMLFCHVIILILVIFCVQEKVSQKQERKNSFWKQAGECISYTLHRTDLVRLMLLIFVSGMVFFTIETYWQPAFTALLDADAGWELGVITFSGFLVTALASRSVARLLKKQGVKKEKSWWKILFLTKGCAGLLVILLALQKHPLTFAAAYAVCYLFYGSSGVVENSLLSGFAPNHLRASIMSLFSLLFQLGAFISAGLSGVVVNILGIGGLWGLAGSFLILTVGCMAF